MTTAQEIKSMKKDLAEMKNLLADQLEDTVSNGHSKTVLTRAEISELAHKAGSSVREFVNGKREQLDAAKVKTQDTIKARPLTSAAVALAGGLLLGAMLRRK